MLLRANENIATLPEWITEGTEFLIIYSDGDPYSNPGSCAMAVSRMSYDEIVKMRDTDGKEIKGRPFCYALITGQKSHELMLHPTPDADMYALFRYAPALKEI